MIPGGFGRKTAVALAALGLFSLVFSLLAERGLWPKLPAGALHGTDLVAGFAAGAGLLAYLLFRRPAGPVPAAGDPIRSPHEAPAAAPGPPTSPRPEGLG